jgi:hypothetical protein
VEQTCPLPWRGPLAKTVLDDVSFALPFHCHQTKVPPLAFARHRLQSTRIDGLFLAALASLLGFDHQSQFVHLLQEQQTLVYMASFAPSKKIRCIQVSQQALELLRPRPSN